MARQVPSQDELNQVLNDFETFVLPADSSLDLGTRTVYGTTDPSINLSMVNVRHLNNSRAFRGRWAAQPVDQGLNSSTGEPIPYQEGQIVVGSDANGGHLYVRTNINNTGNPDPDTTNGASTEWIQISHADDLGAEQFAATGTTYSAGNLVYRGGSDSDAGEMFVFIGSTAQDGTAAPLPGAGMQRNTNWLQVGGSGLTVLDTGSTVHNGINRLEPTHGIQIDVTDQTATIGYGVPPHDPMESYVAGNLVRNSSGSIFEALGSLTNGEPLTDTSSWLQLSAGTVSPRTGKNQFFTVADDAAEQNQGNFQVGDVLYNIARSRFDRVTGVDTSGNVTGRDFIDISEYVTASTTAKVVEPGDIVNVNGTLYLSTSDILAFTDSTQIPGTWVNLTAHATPIDVEVESGTDPYLRVSQGTTHHDVDLTGEHGVMITGTPAASGSNPSINFEYRVLPHDTNAEYNVGNLVRDTSGQIYENLIAIAENQDIALDARDANDNPYWLQLSVGAGSPRTGYSQFFTVANNAAEDNLRNLQVGDVIYNIERSRFDRVVSLDANGRISGRDFLGVTQYINATTEEKVVEPGDIVNVRGTLYLATEVDLDFTINTDLSTTTWINLSANAVNVDINTTAGTNPTIRVLQGAVENDLDLTGGHGVIITGTPAAGTTDPIINIDYRVLEHDANAAYNPGNLVRDTNGQIYENLIAITENSNIALGDNDTNGDPYWLQLSTGSNTGIAYGLEVRARTQVDPEIVLDRSAGSDDRVTMSAGTALTVAGDVNTDSITYTHADIAHTDTPQTPVTLDSQGTLTAVTDVEVNAQGHVTDIQTTAFTLPEVDANDTRVPEWTEVTGGRPENFVTRVGSRLFYSNVDSNVTNPFELIPLAGGSPPALDASNLTITLLNAHATHPDVDPNEPHYTYSLRFESGSDEHVATFRGRDVRNYDAGPPRSATWVIPRSDVTFTPALTSNRIDATPNLEFAATSDQWDSLGGGTGGTSVATADVNLGIFQDNVVVPGSGDNLNFLGMMTAFSGLNNGRGIRGVTFNTANGGRYEIDFREPLPDLTISVNPDPLSFNIGDTIPDSSDFVLTFAGGDGGPYQVTDTHNATPAFNLANVMSPQTVSIDTSSLDGNTAIGTTTLATATVNDTSETPQVSADLQYRVVDNRAIRLRTLSTQNRGVTVLSETGNTVEFELLSTDTSNNATVDLSDGVATTSLAFTLNGTAVTPTLNNRTPGRLTLTLPGTMFIPDGTYTLICTVTDTRFPGAAPIAPDSTTFTSRENRAFSAIIGTEDSDGVVRRSNLDTSSERFNLSLANLDLSNADTNITSVTIDNNDIGNRYTLESDNIHITIPPDQWSNLAGTDTLRVLITDNSITRDTYSQARSIDVEVFEPFFDGTSATTPTATQIQNFTGIERNFAIGNSFPTNGTAGQNFYVVVPSRFTNFGLQPPMSPTFVVPTNVGTVDFQHANPTQGTVSYTIWLVGTYVDTTYTIVSNN